jgi:hypothetical protein
MRSALQLPSGGGIPSALLGPMGSTTLKVLTPIAATTADRVYF